MDNKLLILIFRCQEDWSLVRIKFDTSFLVKLALILELFAFNLKCTICQQYT